MSDVRIPYRAWYILMDSGTNVWTKKMPKTLVLSILVHFGTLVMRRERVLNLTLHGRSLLMDVMEDRHGRKSTMVVGQIPITSWHEVIGDLTLADALMDRWVHGSYQIELDGESMRKKMSQTENTKANKSYIVRSY